ncbi:MAG: ATP-binding protein [Cyanobacteriota bacterium]
MLKPVTFCLHCNKSDRAHTIYAQFGQNCTNRTLQPAMTNPIPAIPAVVKAITSIAKPAASFALQQAQRNELVVKILKEVNLDPVQPPKDLDGVYVYALVEYGVGKPEPILKLWREKEIKKAFWDAYNFNCPLAFLKQTKQLLSPQGQETELGAEIREANVDLCSELEEFGQKFIEVAKRTKSQEFEPYPDWELDIYPKMFKPLIEEKTRIFTGRNFVFKAFEEFQNKNSKGYFTVVGDAGMGKSAIAAKYVENSEQLPPCYFNIRATGQNKPELFLESIRQQLIKRYPLVNAQKDDLTTLLQKVSEKLAADERLVIVIDALDEVEQETGEANLLFLPKEPPERVYFLLTRRPYTLGSKRLAVSPNIPVKELDLRESEYATRNREDVEKYIRFFLNGDPEHKDAIRQWMQERQITDDALVEQVATKSENNFMYLRYVLPEIAKGFYDDLGLTGLPDGLQDYYQVHWVRMKMDTAPQKEKVILLFILVEIGTPITCQMIAGIADQDEFDVQRVLDEEWVEYLTKKEIDGELCYSFYHASFLDFLKNKRELQSTRKLFQEVNQRIADYLY